MADTNGLYRPGFVRAPHLRRYLAPVLISAVVVICSVRPSIAQRSDFTGFSFLRLDATARASALSGAVGALKSNDVDFLFYNPAALHPGMDRSLAVTYLNHLADINAGFVSFGADVGDVGMIGAGFRYLNYGRFERADENGVRDGSTFGASDAALTVGWSRPFGTVIRYGASINGIVSSIEGYAARAVTVDAGLLAFWDEARTGAAVSIHHLGVVADSFGDTSDELPFDIRLAVSHRLKHLPLLVVLTAYDMTDWKQSDDGALDAVMSHLSVGGEFQFGTSFQVRAGYNHARHEALKTKSRLDLAGFGFGFGMLISRFQFDYAYSAWSAIGGLHQLSIRTLL